MNKLSLNKKFQKLIQNYKTKHKYKQILKEANTKLNKQIKLNKIWIVFKDNKNKAFNKIKLQHKIFKKIKL